MLNRLISFIAPHTCLGCEIQGAIICKSCMGTVLRMPAACYRCGTSAPGFTTCPSCRRQTKLAAVSVVAKYQGLAKDIIWKLKFAGAQSAAQDMAAAMALLVDANSGPIVVHVPTATSRVRARGYDQARLLARELAAHTKLHHACWLVRLDQKRQVGASRKERLEQLAGAFRLSRFADVAGAHILLVDDVLTTGATLEAAAAVLKQAGAKRVDAIVFARA